MTIPELKEVTDYIKAKMTEWPHKFCDYYSEKFWNYYKSNGWKVSGKAAMKDWQAAFCAQWQHVKYTEDLAMMDKCMVLERRKKMNDIKKEQAQIIHMQPKNRDVDYIDDTLEEYTKHPSDFAKYRLASCYDWLKENKFVRLTKEQFHLAVEAGKGNVDKGKALATEFVFAKMAMEGKTFKQLARVTA